MESAAATANRWQALASRPSGRLWLFLAYWAFGLAMRALMNAVGPRAPDSLARSLELLTLKTTLSVIVPLYLIHRLRPAVPLLQALGLRAPDDRPRRILLASLIAAGWFALIYGLATAQSGQAPSLRPPGAGLAILEAVHVLVEELAMRGLFLGWLADGRAFWRANLLVSALFLSMHLPGWLAAGVSPELVPMAVVLFALSLVLGWVTRLGGTITVAFVLHLANNAMSGW